MFQNEMVILNELESIVNKESKLARIATLPIKPLINMCDDVYSAISTIKNKKDWLKFGSTLAVCAPIYTIAHEGLHALVAKMFGAYNFEMGINSMFGGELIKKALPSLRTDPEFLEGAYGMLRYNIELTDLTAFNNALVCYAPYTMTFLGVYLLHQGIKKKSSVLKALGIASIINLVNGALAYTGDLSKINTNFIEGTGMLLDNLRISANLLLASGTYMISTKISQGINYLMGRKNE